MTWNNIWHGILLCQHTRDNKPYTISEHAVMKPQLLIIHRITHTLSSGIMLLFVINWLLPNGYYIAALLALSGAVFDVIEVLALNKQTASITSHVDLHEKATWLMALSYLLYVIAISYIADVSPWLYASVFLICVLLFMRARKGKFEDFWIIQMAFFVLISGLGLIAHTTLLLR